MNNTTKGILKQTAGVAIGVAGVAAGITVGVFVAKKVAAGAILKTVCGVGSGLIVNEVFGTVGSSVAMSGIEDLNKK